jgi:hypothetical protein
MVGAVGGKCTYPEVVFPSQVNLRASGDSSMKICPRPVDGFRTVDGNFASGRETVVPPIRVATDECRVMSIVADTATGHGIRISLNGSSESHEGCNDRKLHLARKRGREIPKNEYTLEEHAVWADSD